MPLEYSLLLGHTVYFLFVRRLLRFRHYEGWEGRGEGLGEGKGKHTDYTFINSQIDVFLGFLGTVYKLAKIELFIIFCIPSSSEGE
jgi:hypothetical protein